MFSSLVPQAPNPLSTPHLCEAPAAVAGTEAMAHDVTHGQGPQMTKHCVSQGPQKGTAESMCVTGHLAFQFLSGFTAKCQVHF